MTDRKSVFFILVLLLSATLSFAGIDSKYSSGYTFEETEVGIGEENAISAYKDGTILFLRHDSVMVCKLDTTVTDITAPKLCHDFDSLTITGLVAYDSAAQKIYYTDFDAKLKKYFIYESHMGKGGKWCKGTKINVPATKNVRTNNMYVRGAGYNFDMPVIGNFFNPVLANNGTRIYFSSTFIKDSNKDKKQRDIYYIDLEDAATSCWTYPEAVGAINTDSDDDWMFNDGDSVLYYTVTKGESSNIFASSWNGTKWGKGVKLDEPYNVASSRNMLISQCTPILISDREDEQNRIYRYKMTIEEQKARFYWVFFIFDFNRDILDDAFLNDLDSLCTSMKRFEDTRFEVAGYTDARGADDYNDKLSLRRAQTIKKLMMERGGFTSEQLIATGYGKRALHVPDAKTEEQHAQNRRVTVRVIMDCDKWMDMKDHVVTDEEIRNGGNSEYVPTEAPVSTTTTSKSKKKKK